MAGININFKSSIKSDLGTSGLEVKNTASKGRGLFALREFKVNDVLFEESPLVSCQFAWNEDIGYKSCNYCLRPLETAEENVRRLCGQSDIKLPCPQFSAAMPELFTQCECGVSYCSSECQQFALVEYHSVLCSAMDPKISPLLQNLRDIWKQMHYPPETSTIMLVLRIYAYVHQSADKSAAISHFEDFVSDVGSKNGGIYHKLLNSQFKDNINLLRQALESCVEYLKLEIPASWLSPQTFLATLGLLAMNGQGIGTSPWSQWITNVENCSTLSSDERTALDGFIQDTYNKMEEAVGIEFLNSEGSGLYLLQSKINHSCDPNVEIAFLNGNHTLVVRAVKDIAIGDEICSSYLDCSDLSRSRYSRQNALRENYLFQCTCCKCEEQAADPNETSEEDEDEEMSS